MKRLLIIMPDVPYPPTGNGMSIRYYPLIQRLAGDYEITLICRWVENQPPDLGDLPEFSAAQRVVLYAAIPGSGELDLRPVFDRLQANGRLALYPRCLPDRRLEFVEVHDWGALRPGHHGIPEPEGNAVPLRPEEDLVLAPGLAFDRSGVRLGVGGGYFDRTFASGRELSPRLFGVGYSWQLTDEDLPCELHDRRMDGVVTDRETLRVRNLLLGEPD